MYLHTWEIGPEGAPEIVFCHGLFGQGKNFGQVARALNPQFRSVLVDMPNHGRSDWTPVVSYRGMAEEVADLVMQRGKPVTLLGHSMGGKIAMIVALTRPELVERLIVVDISPVASATIEEFNPLIDAMLCLDLDSLTSRSDADAKLRPGIPNDTVRAFLMQNLRHENVGGNQDWGIGHARWHWMMNLRAIADQRMAVAAFPRLNRTYDGPVLWIAGANSPYIRPEHLAPMRALFPHTAKVTIKGAGHWVHSEQPQAFIETVRRFASGQVGWSA